MNSESICPEDINEKNLSMQLEYIFLVYLNSKQFSRADAMINAVNKQFDSIILPNGFKLSSFRNNGNDQNSSFADMFVKQQEFLDSFRRSFNDYFTKQSDLTKYPFLEKLLALKKSRMEMECELNSLERFMLIRHQIDNPRFFHKLKGTIIELWEKCLVEDEGGEPNLHQIEDDIEISCSDERMIKPKTDSIASCGGMMVYNRRDLSAHEEIREIGNIKEKIQRLPFIYQQVYDAVFFCDFSFKKIRTNKKLRIMQKIGKGRKSFAIFQIENVCLSALLNHISTALLFSNKVLFYGKDKKYLFPLLNAMKKRKMDLERIFVLDGYLPKSMETNKIVGIIPLRLSYKRIVHEGFLDRMNRETKEKIFQSILNKL